MNIPEPSIVHPLGRDLPQQLSALGRTSGIYVFASGDKITHLSSSMDLGRRLRRLLRNSQGEPTILAHKLHGSVVTVQYWVTSSRLESWLLLYALARIHFPEDYMARLRLRLPWFVALVDFDRFARLSVTNRLIRGAESVVGPFPSREAAQRYEEELLGSFSLRRCSEELNPTPDHPGCVYGEIKLCLRPCQLAVGESEYYREAASMKEFLLTNGVGAIRSLTLARDKAAAATDFETAAQLHKRVEKLKTAVKGRDALITEIENFNGVAVTRALGENQWRLWPMLAGFWQEPVTLEAPDDCNAALLDCRLRNLLTPVFLDPSRNGHQGENLAVFARWYYSSWRDGDWIAWPRLDQAPYRKLARSIAKQAQGGATRETAVSC